MANPWDKPTAGPPSQGNPWDRPASSSTPPAAQPSMGPAPPSQHPVQQWLSDLNSDVTEGGNRTLPGRILGHMQGRGDEGYSGLTTGGYPGASKILGSPLTGPIHAAQGVAETPDHPIMGPIHAAEGALETGTIPGMMMGGEGMEAGINAIPSRANASRIFADIEGAAKDVPVSMSKTQPALGDFQQSVATGGKNAPVMTKLAKRIEAPGLPQAGIGPPPINFPEARDFYTNISRATAKPGFLRQAIENPAMPSFRMNAGNVREALNSDLTDAADTIGRGSDYSDAITEYRRAAQLNKVLKTAGKIGAGAAIGSAGMNGSPIIRFIKESQ